MNQTVDSRKYYPTALVLYITYFVLGIAASIMGQYKQDFAAMWDAAVLTDGSYDVSGVVAVIAAIVLGWPITFPVTGPLVDMVGGPRVFAGGDAFPQLVCGLRPGDCQWHGQLLPGH